MRMRVVFLSLLTMLFISGLLFADPVEISFGKFGHWKGEIGQSVEVEFNEKFGSTYRVATLTGSLDRLTDDYLIVGGEIIFLDDLKSITDFGESIPEVDKPPVKGESTTSEESVTTETKTESHKGWMIPLEGRMGWWFGRDDFKSHDWFSYQIVGDLIRSASGTRTEQQKFVVIEINSTGALSPRDEKDHWAQAAIVKERNYICDLIQQHRNKIKFVSYPQLAMGLASTIALTCDEIISSTGCKVGLDKSDPNKVNTYLGNADRSKLVAAAFANNIVVLDEADLIKANLSTQSFSQISAVIVGGTSPLSWMKKINKKKKSSLMKASKFLDDLVDCEEACVKMFGPMSVSSVGGLMKELMDAIISDDGSPEDRRLIEQIATRLRKEIDKVSRTPEVAFEKLGRSKPDKPAFEWTFSSEVLAYMKRLIQFRKDVLPGRQTRIIVWPEHLRSAKVVEKHVKSLKSDLRTMWQPVAFRRSNPKP